MKETVINVLVILGIVLITFFGTRAYYPKVEETVKTDTTYIDRPYEITKIKEVEKPIRITEYKTDTVKVTSTKVVKDTVYINTDLNTFAYDARFLTQYSLAPKFLGLQFANDELELTYQSIDGEVQGKTWNASQGYRVGLNNGQPNIETFNESTEFNYSIGVGYIRFFSYGSPYLQLNTEFSILNLNATATINANINPYGKLGVKYEF